MSKFSGICDIYDRLSDRSDEYLMEHRFFILGYDGKEHEVQINNQKDLAKYYPYSISSSYGYNIHIGCHCLIDREERDFINCRRHDFIRYYNKCKRNRIDYIPEDALIANTIRTVFQPWELELAERVGKFGDKATIDGLHKPLQDNYREEWCNELIRQGYIKEEAYIWVYGWDRYYDKFKEEESIENDGRERNR